MNLPLISSKNALQFRCRIAACTITLIIAITGVATLALEQPSNSVTLNSLQPIQAGSSAGAKLPINYQLSSLTGTVLYATPNGSNTSNCQASTPCTLSRALSQAPNSGTVVLRGGTYRDQRNFTINKPGLRIISYPNEIPELVGSVSVSPNAGWTTENSFRYISYVPRPVTNGGGLPFGDDAAANKQTGCTNLNTDCVGLYPDQVWINGTPLKQVIQKSQLTDGKFFVDRTTNRLYLTATDSQKTGIETSRPGNGTADRDRLFQILSSGVKIEGIKITRYSPSAFDYGVIVFESTASQGLLQNVDISHLPYDGMHVAASNTATVLRNVSLSNVGWQSVNANQTDNLTIDAVRITNTDFFNEFSSSPASGALKTSRNRNTTVKNSYIANNKSHGLWFDQSNINTTVANNTIIDNQDTGIFFEISDGLLLVNNYIKSTGSGNPLRLIGSSGLRLVNNTSIGGAYPLGIYTDDRSAPGCADRPTSNPCQIASDLQTLYPKPASMDWMPRVDLMINNIFANPTGATALCGQVVSASCYMTSHSSGATAPINTIIHKADPARGIPQTFMDGNVYANGTGLISKITNPNSSHSTISTHSSFLSSATGINVDQNSKHGNTWVNSDGSPTSSLVNDFSKAIAVPTDSAINRYVAAGTKQYGALTTASVPVTTTTTTIAPTTTTKPTTSVPYLTVATTTTPTTTSPTTTTTVRPTTTVTTTTIPPVVTTAPLLPPQYAIQRLIAEHSMTKLKVNNYNSTTKVMTGRAYFYPLFGFIQVAADINVTLSTDGSYVINSTNWIWSLTAIP